MNWIDIELADNGIIVRDGEGVSVFKSDEENEAIGREILAVMSHEGACKARVLIETKEVKEVEVEGGWRLGEPDKRG